LFDSYLLHDKIRCFGVVTQARCGNGRWSCDVSVSTSFSLALVMLVEDVLSHYQQEVSVK
jgi:hypothetical protein